MAVFAFWAGLDADSKIGGAIRSAVATRALRTSAGTAAGTRGMRGAAGRSATSR
jgi:hypothetical protein